MTARVSVIMPAYNAETFIADAIDSILAQRYAGEVEIIVVDDGSTDGTPTIVRNLAARHPQIRYLRNTRTKGPAGARNAALLHASGDYVAFLDADDAWLPEHLINGIAFLEKHAEVGVIFFNFDMVEHETKRVLGDWFSCHAFTRTLAVREIEEGYYLICDDLFNALIEESFIHLQSVVMRRRARGDLLFDERLMRSEDRDFFIKLFMQAKAKFAFQDRVTSIYYRHDRSLTADSVENNLHTVLDHVNLFSSYLSAFALDAATRAKVRRILCKKYMEASYLARTMKNYRLATASLYKSVAYDRDRSQVEELAKIIISFLCGDVLPRRRKPT